MWLKYQQVSTKMSSFDPREVMQGRDGVVTKHPLKRFEPTLRTSLQVVIPMNLERLKRHRINIKKFAYSKNWTDLNMEQINASRTAQQLQATIRDLGKIKYQINEDDINQFEKLISPMKHEALAAFHEFSLLQILITSEVQKSISLSNNGDNTKVEENITTAQLIHRPFATSEKDLDEFAELSIFFHDKPASSQIQLGDHMEDDVKVELAVCHSWDQLRDDLMELNGLVNDFSAEVHAQQEYVDIIEDNVDDSHKNVHSAATLLAQGPQDSHPLQRNASLVDHQKVLRSEQFQHLMEKYHDFHEIVNFTQCYEQLLHVHFTSLASLNPDPPSKTRKRFTQKKKAEIRLHYSVSGSFANTARAFDINESTVRGIVNTRPLPDNKKLSSKCNLPGAGRPLTYPAELEDQLLKWVFVLRDLHFPVSVISFQEKAKHVVQPHNPSFIAIRGWAHKFFKRHNLSLRARTSILSKFYQDAARFMRIGKYPLSLVGNMDETPAFFDMVPAKCISKKREECVVRSSGSEKKHLTVVLSAKGDGKMIPPMIIFKGKTEKTIRDLEIPAGFVVKTQSKAWMDDELMKIWVEEIWLKHVLTKCKKLGFENSLLSFDAFSAHLTDGVKDQLLGNNSDILQIPAGCTSKCQPMDVCLNKPFKSVLRKCWVNYVATVVKSFPDGNSSSSKIPVPTCQ
ncbi:uncharacterized protein LOC130641631 [Hydractinia symbiolongicarpus]|uniref:uncharacterized protein LOC130641631 n=1 Tax=Hydractinia symbiolongicarpus TaxID=13093 RepID=UPI00254FBB7F|nr:uncharacterized protein LOC130641631 [Hydractinia symbiolongicarpus]